MGLQCNPVNFGNVYHRQPEESALNRHKHFAYPFEHTNDFFEGLAEEKDKTDFLNHAFLQIEVPKRGPGGKGKVWISNTGGNDTLTEYVLHTFSNLFKNTELIREDNEVGERRVKDLMNKKSFSQEHVQDWYTGGGRTPFIEFA